MNIYNVFLKYLPCFLACSIVALVYAQTLRFGLVWDDRYYLTPEVSRLPNLLNAFFQPFFISDNYYRPLVFISILWQLSFSDFNPAFAHFGNVLLHLINITLLFFVLKKIHIKSGSYKFLIFIFLLVYGLHPALIENVAWISGRFDLMMTTFLLAALVVDGLNGVSPIIKALGIGVLFFLAALCKEMTVVFVFVLPLWHAVKQQDKTLLKVLSCKKNVIIYISLFFFGILYLYFRYLGLDGVFGFVAGPASDFGMLMDSKPLLFFNSLFLYYRQIFLPFADLSPVYIPPLSLSWKALGSVFGIVIFGGTFCLLLVKTRRSLRFLFLALFIALMPVLHILPISLAHSIIHNRFLNFPIIVVLIFLFPLIVSLSISLEGQLRVQKLLLCGVLIWLMCAFTTTVITIPYWKQPLSFWSWAYERSHSGYTAVVYSQQLKSHGRSVLALNILNEVKSDDPMYPAALITMGEILSISQKLEEATNHYKMAVMHSSLRADKIMALTRLVEISIFQKDYQITEGALIQLYDMSHDAVAVKESLCELYEEVIDNPRRKSLYCPPKNKSYLKGGL